MAAPYAGGFKRTAAQVAEYEYAGLDIVWVAEAYGFDAPSFMGYLAASTDRITIGSAVMPIFTRTPTLLAMTAAGIDALSDGRFILGLGSSGPQVVEGWHGVRYDAPVARTREVIEICRAVWRRDGALEHRGRHYRLPLPPEQGTGLGKPLKIIGHPNPHIPIYVAALGEKNVRMTAEAADGWLPVFFVPDKAKDVWGAALDAGRAARDATLRPLEVVAGGAVSVTNDPGPVLDLARPMAALYIGGMGAKERNFYNQLVCRYGFETEAKQVQELYLAGNKAAAEAAVPEELLRLANLVGDEGWIKDRIAAFRDAGVTVLNITPVADKPVELIEKLKDWVDG